MSDLDKVAGSLTSILGSLSHAKSVCSKDIQGCDRQILENRLEFVAGLMEHLEDKVIGLVSEINQPALDVYDVSMDDEENL